MIVVIREVGGCLVVVAIGGSGGWLMIVVVVVVVVDGSGLRGRQFHARYVLPKGAESIARMSNLVLISGR